MILIGGENGRATGVFGMECFQVRDDARIRPFHRPNEFPAHDAFAVNDVSLWPAPGTIFSVAFLCWIIDGNQAHIMALHKSAVAVRVLVCRDRQNSYVISELVLHLDQGRKFLDTRRTPRCPEVQDHDLALVVVERDSSLWISNGEVGG